MIRNKNVKLIAMYFPQFHSIPENCEWWGKGFTDWDHVRASKPQFSSHYQPRVPLNSYYYDQSKLETVKWQIDLARKYGIYGFCHYHYWFDGKQMLETPTNLLLENKDIDFPFCLSWANETWTRRWDGSDHHVLIHQTHPPTQESWKRHFDYLFKVWSDPRSIKVDEKPIFAIYRPHLIEQVDQMIDYWRELAHKAGLPGLYIMAQKQYEFPNRDCIRSFDAAFQFQPFEAFYSPDFPQKLRQHSFVYQLAQRLPQHIKDMLRRLHAIFKKDLTFYDYETVWEHVIRIRPEKGLDTYPGAFMDWDNTPRYKGRATVFHGANPDAFQMHLGRLIETMPDRALPENFIFINAWNEWSEGTYLEPDEKYGYRYLEAIKQVVNRPK